MAVILENFHQTVGFHFAVSFTGLKANDKSLDARFQSVNGLDVQFDTETLKEGGENRFEHVLPVRRKYSDLVLKRGLIAPGNAAVLTKWCLEAFDNFIVVPTNLEVLLFNEDHKPLMKWEIIHAWPKNWKMGELNAEKSEVMIESLELNYNYFNFKNP